jgi:hypothetical protein
MSTVMQPNPTQQGAEQATIPEAPPTATTYVGDRIAVYFWGGCAIILVWLMLLQLLREPFFGGGLNGRARFGGVGEPLPQ